MDSTTPRQPAEHDSTAPTFQGRRNLITAGTAGLAATAFLAACSGSDAPRAGLSGEPAATTLVAPTVPNRRPTQAQLQADKDTLATANSLEVLAAQTYQAHGSKVTQLELVEAATRFAEDHTAAAAVFAEPVADHDGVGKPNEYLLTNMVEPLRSLLTSEASVADLFSSIESSIAATYIAATGTMLEASWRQTFAEHAAAAARRAAVWGKGGTGLAPNTALYPMSDLISAAAYLSTAEEEAAEGEGGETTTTEAEAEG